MRDKPRIFGLPDDWFLTLALVGAPFLGGALYFLGVLDKLYPILVALAKGG